MPYGIMATNAVQRLRTVSESVDSLNDICMTVPACAFSYGMIRRLDANIVGKMPCREGKGMMESVHRLDIILADEIVRGVTVITDGHMFVAGFDPSVKVILHDMAVGAGFRRITHVGKALGVDEGVAADSQAEADDQGEEEGHQHSAAHPPIGGIGLHESALPPPVAKSCRRPHTGEEGDTRTSPSVLGTQLGS